MDIDISYKGHGDKVSHFPSFQILQAILISNILSG